MKDVRYRMNESQPRLGASKDAKLTKEMLAKSGQATHQKKLDTTTPPRPADQKDDSQEDSPGTSFGHVVCRSLPNTPPEVESADYEVPYSLPNDKRALGDRRRGLGTRGWQLVRQLSRRGDTKMSTDGSGDKQNGESAEGH